MKTYFKSIFVTLTPFVLSLVGAYLIGSFINVSFNPADWPPESRFFMSISGMVFGFMLFTKLNFEGLA